MQRTDVYIAIIVFLSFLPAYRTGFVGEMLKIGAYILSGIGCAALLPHVQPLIEGYIPYPSVAKSATAILTAYVLFRCFRILARQIKGCLGRGALRQADRAAGGVFGIARGYAFVVLFALFMAVTSPDKAKDIAKDSLLFPKALETADEIKDWFGSFSSLADAGEKIKEEAEKVKDETADSLKEKADSLKEKADDLSDGLLP